MDKKISIMPCLDMQNGRVVKGVHFVDIRDAGDPVECAKAYCQAGADELALLDITATVENRPTMLEVVKNVAAAATVPFTVGGGISDDDNLCRPPPAVSRSQYQNNKHQINQFFRHNSTPSKKLNTNG